MAPLFDHHAPIVWRLTAIQTSVATGDPPLLYRLTERAKKMETLRVIYRVVSAGAHQLERRAFRGYVEVVTIAADGSVFNDVLQCRLLRETEADAYADGAALKGRLEIREITRETAFD
jgi:hypothetical protein